jgi:uncharacterized protein YgbK (DUF1537 family)
VDGTAGRRASVNERWLIIADDLTGAADSAIAFAKRGLVTRVLVHRDGFAEQDTDVLSIDVDTRKGTAADAAASHQLALRRYCAPDRNVFKKIDSTLRGHLAAEIAAMRTVLAEHQRATFGILAPAFPAMGRTTLEGRVFVHGKPLEQSETWKREHSFPNADLGEILASAGLSPVKVPLAVVRAGVERLRATLRSIARTRRPDGLGTVAICDAENDEDLDNIVAGAHPDDARGMLIGTAGLARAIARTLPAVARVAPRLAPSNAGVLLVVGSLASVSRAAAREVAVMSGVVHLRVEPQLLLAGRSAELARVYQVAVDSLSAGVDVLIEIAADGDIDVSRGPALAASLSDTLHGLMACSSGAVVTGGETARAMLASNHISGIELLDEIEDGVCLGLAQRDPAIPLITKSGAFGNAHSLVHALEKLRMIRTSGQVA